MSKTGKNKNDLRGLRKETGLIFVIGAAVCIAVFALLSALVPTRPAVIGIAVLFLYTLICGAAYYFLEHYKKGGANNETLAVSAAGSGAADWHSAHCFGRGYRADQCGTGQGR